MSERVPQVETKVRIPLDLYKQIEELKTRGSFSSINAAMVEAARLIVKRNGKKTAQPE
jgi:Arc/MetJ-type ribon-helix-helix transcriptional regulator